MPLDNGYGFIRGTLTHFFPDTPEDQGEYFHINTRVDVNGSQYEGPIDVDSKNSAVGVEWRQVTLATHELQPLLELGVGYHALAMNENSGAIDYIRSPMFAVRLGCAAIIAKIFGWKFDIAHEWEQGSNIEAYANLKPLMTANKNRANGIMVFGEPYDDGDLGLHNIHQNQGDPIDSPWGPANGTWQDGCTLFEQSDDRWIAFLNKFSSQSYLTDDNGDPLP